MCTICQRMILIWGVKYNKGKNSSSDKFVARIDFNKTGWLEEKIIVRLDGNLTPTIINTINAGVMGYVVKYHGHIK